MDTLVNRIHELSCLQSDKMAVAFKKEVLSYSELFEASLHMALLLKELDVKKGDSVSFSAVSKPEMVVTYLALQMIGAVSVYLDKNSTAANMYDIYYRVHGQNFGWLDWAKNGQEAGTQGYAYRLEAIEIKLVEKGGQAPDRRDR